MCFKNLVEQMNHGTPRRAAVALARGEDLLRAVVIGGLRPIVMLPQAALAHTSPLAPAMAGGC